MSRWLTCDLCTLRKPVGIMSGQAWREINSGASVARACPDCQEKYPDWQQRLERIADRSA